MSLSMSHDDSRHISKISKLLVWHRIIQRSPIDMLSLPLNKVNLVLGDQTHGVSGYASLSLTQKQEVHDVMYGDDILEIPWSWCELLLCNQSETVSIF
jgi:hypothetical protein